MTRLRRTPQIRQPHKNNDITGKFAEMSLTPSQRQVTRVLANSPRPSNRPYQYQGDPKTAHKILGNPKMYRRSRMTTPPRDRHTVLQLHDNGLPMPVYNLIKKAVDILEHLKTHPDDEEAKFNLKCTENGIDIASSYFKSGKAMPSDWEYERDNAHKLLM